MAVPIDLPRRRFGASWSAGLVIVAALVGLPGTASAAGSPDELRDLATRAIEHVSTERALLGMAGDAAAGSPEQQAAAREQLTQVDAAGTALLAELVESGTAVSAAVRAALGPLPLAAGGITPSEALTYRAAITDLLDLATTVAPPITSSDGGGLGFRALATVALTLVAIGLTALLVSLRSARPHRELTALAWSDALTGVANRRRLEHDLTALAAGDSGGRHRHPTGGPTAVIMVDIDRFKDINDHHGHRFGDDVLRAVGAMLVDQVRTSDAVYRYGGEEFCILLPGTSDASAARVAERILGAARRLEFPGDVRITVSAGVADGAGPDIERTLRAADAALLRAKRSGRDRAAPAFA